MAVARRRAINLPVGVPPVIEELVDEAAAEDAQRAGMT